jgi:hypothetical protein
MIALVVIPFWVRDLRGFITKEALLLGVLPAVN